MQHRVNIQYSAFEMTRGQVNETRKRLNILFSARAQWEDDSMKTDLAQAPWIQYNINHESVQIPSCHWSNAPLLALHLQPVLLLHPPLPPPSAVTASLEEQPSLPEPPSLRTVAIRVKENITKCFPFIHTPTSTNNRNKGSDRIQNSTSNTKQE